MGSTSVILMIAMSDVHDIELTVPGLLQFRDVALRVIMESCKLVGKLDAEPGMMGSNGSARDSRVRAAPGLPLSDRYEFEDRFTLEFASAFSEIYNNIPIHAYEGGGKGNIEFKIRIGRDHLIVDITDTGKSFDLDSVPAPEEIAMGGMGIHIARSMLDELEYRSGPPNRWRLVKYMGERRGSLPADAVIAKSST